jgi:hypothetical protein
MAPRARFIPALLTALVFVAASAVPCGLSGSYSFLSESDVTYFQMSCPCGCDRLPHASGASNGFDPVLRPVPQIAAPQFGESAPPAPENRTTSLDPDPEDSIPIAA